MSDIDRLLYLSCIGISTIRVGTLIGIEADLAKYSIDQISDRSKAAQTELDSIEKEKRVPLDLSENIENTEGLKPFLSSFELIAMGGIGNFPCEHIWYITMQEISTDSQPTIMPKKRRQVQSVIKQDSHGTAADRGHGRRDCLTAAKRRLWLRIRELLHTAGTSGF
jgi:hypothetical protein